MGLCKISLAFVFLLGLTLVHLTLAQDTKEDYLNAHNAARTDVGVPSLTWDDIVAAYAQNYANQRIGDCNLVHSGGQYGENIAWGSADLSGTDAVKMWVDEKANYDNNSNSCVGGECLHYTQVVWRNSVHLGCAKVRCNSGGTFIGCNYDPPGNYVGEKPYQQVVYNKSTGQVNLSTGTTGQVNLSAHDDVIRWKSQSRDIKWWIWLVVAVGVIIIISLSLLRDENLKKLKAEGEQKKKQEMLLQELRGNAIPSTVNDKVKKHNNDSNDLQIFSFEIISAATSNFSTENKLGEGGFGPVYKGKLSNGQEIAIKRLSRSSGQGLVEFKNEAILIAKVQHTNLVRLLGFCIQQEENIPIYEYMPNKSLDFFLFDSTKTSLLNWKKRFNIIEGIAQGLVYLHKYSRLRVIHRDLKASNILLDEEMNPKISDFGMARIFGLKGSEENTNRIVGTYGYMSPEYAMNGVVSMKTDVFSYGVLLLEIVSNKRNNSRYHSDHPLNLIGYAWQLWNEGKSLELIDPTILDESCLPSEVLRCIHVGLLCVQDQATDRPTMLDVVSMLSNETFQLFPPKQPAFFINTIKEELSEVSEIKPENYSINNVTHSMIEAR